MVAKSLQEITYEASAPNNEKDEVNYVRLPCDPATKAMGVLQTGEQVTGAPSGATGDIVRIGANTEYVDVTNVAGGPFANGDTLTGTDSSATVDMDADPTDVDPVDFRTAKRGAQIVGQAA